MHADDGAAAALRQSSGSSFQGGTEPQRRRRRRELEPARHDALLVDSAAASLHRPARRQRWEVGDILQPQQKQQAWQQSAAVAWHGSPQHPPHVRPGTAEATQLCSPTAPGGQPAGAGSSDTSSACGTSPAGPVHPRTPAPQPVAPQPPSTAAQPRVHAAPAGAARPCSSSAQSSEQDGACDCSDDQLLRLRRQIFQNITRLVALALQALRTGELPQSTSPLASGSKDQQQQQQQQQPAWQPQPQAQQARQAPQSPTSSATSQASNPHKAMWDFGEGSGEPERPPSTPLSLLAAAAQQQAAEQAEAAAQAAVLAVQPRGPAEAAKALAAERLKQLVMAALARRRLQQWLAGLGAEEQGRLQALLGLC